MTDDAQDFVSFTTVTFSASQEFYELLCGLAYVAGHRDIGKVIRNAVILLDIAVEAQQKGETVQIGEKRVKVLP